RMLELLQKRMPDLKIATEPSVGPTSHPMILTGHLSSGFRSDEWKTVFITEHDLFRDRKHVVSLEVNRDDIIASISELKIGDPVVHIDFGVGIFRGLERITAAGIPNDFLHLEYAGKDKLYLPIYRLNKIQRYIGADSSSPKIDRLGNQSNWENVRK